MERKKSEETAISESEMQAMLEFYKKGNVNIFGGEIIGIFWSLNIIQYHLQYHLQVPQSSFSSTFPPPAPTPPYIPFLFSTLPYISTPTLTISWASCPLSLSSLYPIEFPLRDPYYPRLTRTVCMHSRLFSSWLLQRLPTMNVHWSHKMWWMDSSWSSMESIRLSFHSMV